MRLWTFSVGILVNVAGKTHLIWFQFIEMIISNDQPLSNFLIKSVKFSWFLCHPISNPFAVINFEIFHGPRFRINSGSAFWKFEIWTILIDFLEYKFEMVFETWIISNLLYGLIFEILDHFDWLYEIPILRNFRYSKILCFAIVIRACVELGKEIQMSKNVKKLFDKDGVRQFFEMRDAATRRLYS